MNTDKTLRRLALIFSVLGLVVSFYLIYIKFNPASLLCTGVGDCEAVNSSIYSTFYGIPIAVFGALAYAALLVLLLLESRVAFLHSWGTTLEFGLSFAGVLYSAYLTYIEIAVIHKICPYCVTSAIAITVICVISGIRLFRALAPAES